MHRDSYLDGPVQGGQLDHDRLAVGAVYPGDPDLVDPPQGQLLVREGHRRLRGRNVADPTAQQGADHFARVSGVDELARCERQHPPVHQPGRQHEDVRGEPLPADVAALPHPVPAQLCQCAGDLPAAQGTAHDVPAVCADEDCRLQQMHALGTVQSQVKQVGVETVGAPSLLFPSGPAVGQPPPTQPAGAGPPEMAYRQRPDALRRGLSFQLSCHRVVETRLTQTRPPPRPGLFDEQDSSGGECGAEHRVATQLGAQGAALQRLARDGDLAHQG